MSRHCLKCRADLSALAESAPPGCGTPIPPAAAFTVRSWGAGRWLACHLCGPCLRHTYGSLIIWARRPGEGASPKASDAA
jgi:hypothetical protein